MRKTIIAIGAAICLFAAACGGSGSDSVSSGGLTDGVPDADIELTVWSFQPLNYDGGEEAYQSLMDSFTAEYPNVTIDLVSIPFDAYWDQFRNSTVAGTGPDVVSMYGGTTAAGYAGGLAPIQDALSDDQKSDLRYLESSYGPDGNLYALPTGSYGYFLTVNTAMLGEAGVDPGDLATWDGMLGACTALSDAGMRAFSTGWADGYQLETFLYMMTSQIFDPAGLAEWNGAKIGLADPRFEIAIDRLLEMNDAGCFPEESLGLAMYDDAFTQIAAGEAAIFTAGGPDAALEAATNLGEGNIAILPFPQLPESQYEAIIDSGPEVGWAITSWSDNQSAAWALVSHLASADSQQIIWDSLGIPPNSASISVEGDGPLMTSYLALLDNPDNHTAFMAFTQPALALLEREASNLIAGRITASDLLAQADEAQQRALSELDE